MQLPKNIDATMFFLHRALRRGEFILFFADTAGEGSDWNAGHGLSKESLDIPLTMHYEGSITDVTPQLQLVLEWIYDVTGIKPVVAYETNNGGIYELERLNRLNLKGKYIIYYQYELNREGNRERTNKMGWNTNSATRPVMLSGVKDLVNNQLVRIYHAETINEMFSFVKKKTPSGWRAEAETGAFDDLILALAGVWQLYQTEEPQSDYEEDDIAAPDWVRRSMGV